MTDTFARMRQIIGSTAEWTANDIVLGYGEMGIERVSASKYLAKVGDGSAKWSALPYLSASDTVINSATQAALNAMLPKAGGTMTGPLILSHDAVAALEPVTLTQLNNEVTKLTATLSGKLDKSGGTMTGPLMLARDGAGTLEAVTVEQLNKAISGISFVTSGSLVFAGTVDMTAGFAMPSPPPTTGQFYTVTKTGATEPTWNPHLAGTPPANVALADYIVWDAANNKFHFISNAMATGSSAYVPITGTNAMGGAIMWSGAAGSKKGSVMIDTKGGTIDDAAIDAGAY